MTSTTFDDGVGDHHPVLITNHGTRVAGDRPSSTFQIRCRCGESSEVVSRVSLVWEWYDMHRDGLVGTKAHSEVGTSEPPPGVTN